MSQKLRIPYQKVSTTVGNASVTALTVPLISGSSCNIDIKITGRITGGTLVTVGATFGAHIDAVAKNVSGTATVVGSTTVYSAFDTDMNTATVSVSASSGNFIVTATGPSTGGGEVIADVEWLCWADLIVN